jgi:hypothetical protein
MTVPRLKAVYETARRLDLPVIEMMFHSSELMPNGSPHNLTEAAVDRLFERLEQTFAFLASRQVSGTTLSAYAERVRTEAARASSAPLLVHPAEDLTWAPAQNSERRHA